VGPSTLATVILGLTFLGICADTFMLVARAMESEQTMVKRAVILAAIIIQIIAFYSYERHYMVCQSWKGWFICCIGVLLTSLVIQQIVFTPDPDPRSDGNVQYPQSSSANHYRPWLF
jgi:hypothetical protein